MHGHYYAVECKHVNVAMRFTEVDSVLRNEQFGRAWSSHTHIHLIVKSDIIHREP